MPRDVKFLTEDGTELRGTVHNADPQQPSPANVMAHGFSGVKEQIDHYAAAFAAGGFAVLVFDHRTFGESAGSPRREVDAFRQLSDWRDAITYALDRPEFDRSAPLGIWGSSFAGGLAIVLGATDPRVASIVAQIPSIDAVRTQAPTWENDVTLRSIENMLAFEPAGWLPFVAPKPLLFIIAENDTCTYASVQQDAFATAGEPKALVAHPGGHFDTYTTHFDSTSRAALDWFRRSAIHANV